MSTRPYPQTFLELKAEGYTQTGNGRCRNCGEPLEWWMTSNGRSLPFDPMPELRSAATPHWKTCPKADGRKEKK